MNREKDVENSKVMSRVEWFRDLKLIFNQVLKEEDVLTPVPTELILNELKIKAPMFDLKNPKEYESRSKVQVFSLAEVTDHIVSLDELTVNFDHLIDSLIYLSINKKRKEKLDISVDLERQMTKSREDDNSPKNSIEKSKEISKEKPSKNVQTTHSEFTQERRLKLTEKISLIIPKEKRVKASDIAPSPTVSNVQPILNLEPQPRPLENTEFIQNPNLEDKRIEKPSKENIRTITRSITIIKDESLDLSFPISRLDFCPDLKPYACLLHLSLAGNKLSSSEFPFPLTLTILNISSNQIVDLKFEVELTNLKLLNAGNNKIQSLSNMNRVKNIRELYLDHNFITSINMLCHLGSLVLLDCSNNNIEVFENIAGLVISKRLGILKLSGNPLSTNSNYDRVATSILPRINCFDPINIIELSSFKSIEEIAFTKPSSKQTIVQTPNKPLRLSSGRSETSLSRHITKSIEQSHIFEKKLNNRQPSLVISGNSVDSGKRLQRSMSQTRVNHDLDLETASNASVNATKCKQGTRRIVDFSPSVNIMDMAERRIKVIHDDFSGRTNISIVSNESIQNVGKRAYGNPVAAMMIGPPAVTVKGKVPGKQIIPMSNHRKSRK